MELAFNKNIYPLICIEKAAFVFTEDAYIHIDEDDEHYIVSVIPKEQCSIPQVEHEFENELLAQILRENIYERTKETRNLIIARALSSAVITDIPLQSLPIEENLNDNLDSILKDWFENGV